MPQQEMTVGFIGLGNMGFAMAGNLAARSFKVQGFDVNREAVDRLAAEKRITGCASAADAAAGCDVLILMLPNGAIVRKVLLEQDGEGSIVADVLKRGATVIDMSSSAPMGTRRLGEEMAKFDAGLIDAPVSGGVARAVTGKLAIIVGGEEALVERCRPVLEAMGSSIIRVGDLGAGHAMKALNNYVSAAGLVAACEAVHIAREFGIDGQTAVDVLNASTGRNNATENKLAQFVLSRSFASGFNLSLMCKDLATALDLAHELGVPNALAEEVVALWSQAEKTLPAGADHTEIARVFET